MALATIPVQSAIEPLRDRLNLIWVMLWQAFMPRQRRESMKLVWVFLEPMGQLALLVALFALIGRTGGYGRSFALFLLTGIVVLQIFNRGSEQIALSIEKANSPRRMPDAGLFHGAIAQTMFQWLTAAIYAPVLAYVVWWWYRVEVVPAHPEVLLLAVALTGMLAFGIGLIRGYCRRFLPVGERLFKTLSRGLILISGVFYMASWLPPDYRYVLSYNPILQLIELVRLGVYFEYPTTLFSMTYLMSWCLGSVTFAMALIWVSRKRLRE
ncbi:MAG: ABC transporter permease [Pseudomonadota bacterium]